MCTDDADFVVMSPGALALILIDLSNWLMLTIWKNKTLKVSAHLLCCSSASLSSYEKNKPMFTKRNKQTRRLKPYIKPNIISRGKFRCVIDRIRGLHIKCKYISSKLLRVAKRFTRHLNTRRHVIT